MQMLPLTETAGGLSNIDIAARLDEMADRLADRGGNPYRIRAFRRGAVTIAQLDEPVADIVARDGLAGLTRLPTIGRSLGRALAELVTTGRWGRLEALLPAADPFCALPGVGPALARRLRDALSVDSLAELDEAARDGRLGRVPGVGPRRAAAIRIALGEPAWRRWRLTIDRHRKADPGVSAGRAINRGIDTDLAARHRGAETVPVVRM